MNADKTPALKIHGIVREYYADRARGNYEAIGCLLAVCNNIAIETGVPIELMVDILKEGYQKGLVQ